MENCLILDKELLVESILENHTLAPKKIILSVQKKRVFKFTLYLAQIIIVHEIQ
nr:MAG TPA: hypothetical protein [Caudoviricetes sp.]